MPLPLSPEETIEYNNVPTTPKSNPLGDAINQLFSGGGGGGSGIGATPNYDITSQIVQFCRANSIPFTTRMEGWSLAGPTVFGFTNTTGNTLILTALRGESSGGTSIFEDPTLALDMATTSEQITEGPVWAVGMVGIVSPNAPYWTVDWAAPIYIADTETFTGTWAVGPVFASGTFTTIEVSAADAAIIRAAFRRLYLADATLQFVTAGPQVLTRAINVTQNAQITAVQFGMFDPASDPDFTDMNLDINGVNIVDITGATYPPFTQLALTQDRCIGFDVANTDIVNYTVTLDAPPIVDTDVMCLVYGTVP